MFKRGIQSIPWFKNTFERSSVSKFLSKTILNDLLFQFSERIRILVTTQSRRSSVGRRIRPEVGLNSSSFQKVLAPIGRSVLEFGIRKKSLITLNKN